MRFPLHAALLLLFLLMVMFWAARVDRQSHPMWPGAKFTFEQRDEALRRGLNYIYQLSRQPAVFAENGTDMLGCFYMVAAVATDPHLRDMANSMGLERASVWRAAHPRLPANLSAERVTDFAFANMSADALGLPDPELKEQIRMAARRFTPEDYFRFDPAEEGPPYDIPARCQRCRLRNARGTMVCHRCGNPLRMIRRSDLMYDALVTTYSGDRYGIWLGGSFGDVVHWIPTMRPYPTPKAHDDDFDSTAYLITHIVYTLNDYSLYRLKRAWLQPEYDFLRTWFRSNIDTGDVETLGEFMDTLRSLGVGTNDPQLREGVEFLLSRQNPDGSWGSSKDLYTRYHTTWTSLGGLMDYQWRGERLSFPEVLPRLLEQR